VTNFINVNLKVVVMDSDYYALQAMNGYLAWDRRTRVTYLAESHEDLLKHLDRVAQAELPDAVILDADHLGGASGLRNMLSKLNAKAPNALLVCVAQNADAKLIEAAAASEARAYLLKGEVRSQVAWSVVYAHVLSLDFVMTPGVQRAAQQSGIAHPRLRHAFVLPRRREYPELTGRVRQAMELVIIKGMPALLAADEMGISLHTIRSYIKDGYRILEAYDETEYPVDMSPQERAFMRLTRFEDDEAMQRRAIPEG
jgi:DNA-binding NarL/FixJ family response regulator